MYKPRQSFLPQTGMAQPAQAMPEGSSVADWREAVQQFLGPRGGTSDEEMVAALRQLASRGSEDAMQLLDDYQRSMGGGGPQGAPLDPRQQYRGSR